MTARVSAALRTALTTPSALFVAPSEPAGLRSDQPIARVLEGQAPPAAVGPASSPRALAIVPEGGGFALHALVALSDGTLELAKVESFDANVVAELSRFLTDPVKRSQIAVVYSRTADSLFVAHAADLAQPPLPPRLLRRPSPSPIAAPAAWQTSSLAMSGTFRPAVRAVYSPRDWRIWALDRSAAPALGWRLRRIDPFVGVTETSLQITALAGIDDLWLTTWEDGRVLLIVNRKSGDNNNNNNNDDQGDDNNNNNEGDGGDGQFVVALLSSEPFKTNGKLTVEGVFAGKGQVMVAPKVSRGVLSLMITRKKKKPDDDEDGKGAKAGIDVIALTLADLTGKWDDLAESLGGSDVELD